MFSKPSNRLTEKFLVSAGQYCSKVFLGKSKKKLFLCYTVRIIEFEHSQTSLVSERDARFYETRADMIGMFRFTFMLTGYIYRANV